MNQVNQVGPAPGESNYSAESPGYLLSNPSLLILLGLLLLAAWNRQVIIVVLLGLVLSAAVVAKLWSRWSLVGVRCQRTVSENRAFPGEDIELKLHLSNRKLLPLPWVQADDEIPNQLAPEDLKLEPGNRPGCKLLSNSASLLWYTAINWRYRLHCRKRGYYRLGPVTVSSGDIFGFYPRSVTGEDADHVIVYPKLYEISRFDVPSLYPIGETQAERRIFQDPSRTIGVRDYCPDDSLRHIHWKASARHQNLQVKVFEPTTTLEAAIFLAVDSFQSSGVNDEDNFELGISAAASVANYLDQKRSPVGLFANTHPPDEDQSIRMLPGRGSGRLMGILETLAKVVLAPSGPFDDFLQKEWSCLPWGTTLILVLSRPPEFLPAQLTRMKEAGYKVLVLQIGGNNAEMAGYAAAWHNINSPEDLYHLRSGRSD